MNKIINYEEKALITEVWLAGFMNQKIIDHRNGRLTPRQYELFEKKGLKLATEYADLVITKEDWKDGK